MAANGPEEVDVQALQQRVIRDYDQLREHQDAVKGEFKRVIPLGDGRAVAVMTQQTDDAGLKRECQYLERLQQSGIPALNTYGEVFRVGKDQHPAVIVDWLPNSTLVDVKHPDAMRAVVPAMVLGVKVGKGEGGLVFSQAAIKKAIDDIPPDASSLAAIKEKAKELAQAFTELDRRIKGEKLHIIDLQVLVGRDNQLTVIDPQEVLTAQNVDVLDPNKKVDLTDKPDLTQFINEARGLLANYAKMLEAVSKANNVDELKKALSSEPVKKAAAKGGNPLLRKAVEAATANRAYEAGRQSAPPETRRTFLMSEGAIIRPKSAPANLPSPPVTDPVLETKENNRNDRPPSKPGSRK